MTAQEPPEDAPAEQDARPVVDLPSTGLPAAAIVVIAAVLAIGLFLMLDARRHAVSAPALQSDRGAPYGAFEPPPALVLPADPPVALHQAAMEPAAPLPPVNMVSPPTPTYTMPAPQDGPVLISQPPPPPLSSGRAPGAPQGSLNEPALVVDAGPGEGGGTAAAGDDSVKATLIRGRATVIPQGTLIGAILETPIDSTRPGMVRAIVAEDMSGFDGTRVLIPRGSRLVGEYLSDIQTGQKRVLVNWTRLIRPDGVAIRIGSPVADPLGQAGVPGRTDTHFLARFAGAVLQSALAAGVNLASRAGDGSVIVGASPQITGQVGQSLAPSADLRPTIKVREGARIAVFVAHDLDFTGTPSVR